MDENASLSKQTYIVVLIIFLIIIVISVSVFIYRHNHKQPPPPIQPTYVTYAKATANKWQKHIVTTGTVYAIHGVIVRAEIAGRVTKLFQRPSSWIEKGQPLLTINPEGLAQQLANDEEQVVLTNTHRKQLENLINSGSVSKWQLQQAEIAYQQAVAERDKTSQQLALTKVTAPFSGRIGVYIVHVGDFVNVGDDMLSIQNPKRMRVDFTIPSRYIHDIKIGQQVIVEASGLKKPIEATIYAVNANVNIEDRTLLVRANFFRTEQQDVTPGLFGTVTVLLDAKEETVTIPQTSVVYTAEGTFVFKVVDDIAHLVAVDIGERRHDMIDILNGLKPGDIVVSLGKNKIHEGARLIDNTNMDNHE